MPFPPRPVSPSSPPLGANSTPSPLFQVQPEETELVALPTLKELMSLAVNNARQDEEGEEGHGGGASDLGEGQGGVEEAKGEERGVGGGSEAVGEEWGDGALADDDLSTSEHGGEIVPVAARLKLLQVREGLREGPPPPPHRAYALPLISAHPNPPNPPLPTTTPALPFRSYSTQH